MTQVKGVALTVEGRKFVQESPSFEQEMFIMATAVESGLDQMALNLTPDEKDLESSVKLLLIKAYQSGALFLLMASLVTEEGTEWSPEQAHRNAEIFRTTRDKDAKDQLRPALVGALLAFFESGVNSKQISDISSVLEDDAHEQRKNSEPNSVPSQDRLAALFNSGLTATSSEKSPSTSTKRRKTSSR